jgi:competence protein ComEC
MDNGLSEDAADYNQFDTKAREEDAVRLVARASQKIVLDDGVELEILFPERDMVGSEANDASVIARLTYGDIEFLFTGDAPNAVEDQLVRRYSEALSSDVLKLGHHGSNTSSSNYFLSSVRPKYAVISAGRDNRYGHPHAEVLLRLAELDIPYINTAEAGTITFKSDGQQVSCQNCD